MYTTTNSPVKKAMAPPGIQDVPHAELYAIQKILENIPTNYNACIFTDSHDEHPNHRPSNKNK
jgi:hypothetical protein